MPQQPADPAKDSTRTTVRRPQYQPTREELLAENQSLFEEMNAMEVQHEKTLTAAVEALEKSARERRALERQVHDLHTANELLQKEKVEWNRERDELKSEIEEMKKDYQSASNKAITALKDRESVRSQLIAVECETGKLLDWLIEEGRLLEAEEEETEESLYEPSLTEEDEEEEEGSLLELKEKLEKKQHFTPRFSRTGKGKKIGSSKLGQSSSLSTLYATAIATTGAMTPHTSHNKLVASNASLNTIDSTSAVKSTEFLADGTFVHPTEKSKSTSASSHLKLSVCSLAKLAEGKIPASTNMDARILAQLSQITELLKAVLALQEETDKQLWSTRKRAKVLETQLKGLSSWKDCVMARVGAMNVRKVPLEVIKSPSDMKDPLETTRELAKRLQNANRQAAAFLLESC